MSGERPAIDVVVPFAGDAGSLAALVARLGALRVRPGDSIVVANNRPAAARSGRSEPREGWLESPTGGGRVEVVDASERRGSYFARNVGARAGSAPWLLFVDADVTPANDLLERLFDPMPADRAGVLAGAVVDEPPPTGRRGRPALRYAWLKSSMSQEITLGHGEWAFAQTANCAVRREAFAAVGGFADDARSGGDADLCYRLAAAGWQLESRPGAAVIHHNRRTVPRMLAQRARHGTGAAWLSERHPGALPARSLGGVALWGVRRAGEGLGALARGDRDAALLGLLDGPAVWAFELGRRLPNRHYRR